MSRGPARAGVERCGEPVEQSRDRLDGVELGERRPGDAKRPAVAGDLRGDDWPGRRRTGCCRVAARQRARSSSTSAGARQTIQRASADRAGRGLERGGVVGPAERGVDDRAAVAVDGGGGVAPERAVHLAADVAGVERGRRVLVGPAGPRATCARSPRRAPAARSRRASASASVDLPLAARPATQTMRGRRARQAKRSASARCSTARRSSGRARAPSSCAAPSRSTFARTSARTTTRKPSRRRSTGMAAGGGVPAHERARQRVVAARDVHRPGTRGRRPRRSRRSAGSKSTASTSSSGSPGRTCSARRSPCPSRTSPASLALAQLRPEARRPRSGRSGPAPRRARARSLPSRRASASPASPRPRRRAGRCRHPARAGAREACRRASASPIAATEDLVARPSSSIAASVLASS